MHKDVTRICGHSGGRGDGGCGFLRAHGDRKHRDLLLAGCVFRVSSKMCSWEGVSAAEGQTGERSGQEAGGRGGSVGTVPVPG